MGKTATFLQLSPEFGGTRFGPFEMVEIRLGSDPEQNDITLPATLGVAEQHVKVLRQQDESFIIAPVDRQALIWLYRKGKGRPKPVTSPVAVMNGDGFALVTPEGPRFNIQIEKNQQAIAEAAEGSVGPGWPKGMKRPKGLSGRSLTSEIKRRGFAAVFTTRLGNMWMRAWQMIKTGQIFSPVYIVGGLIMCSGWLFAGGAACSALKFNSNKNTYQSQLSNCRDSLGVADDGSGGSDPTVPDLTRTIFEDREWRNTLVADKNLYAAYAAALRVVFAEPSRYRWAYTRKNSPYTNFKAALEATGLPADLVRVLAFSAARPGFDREWALVDDSEGAEVCGRGALALTFRQALQLGLTEIQPDALMDRQEAESNDLEMQREALDATIKQAGTEFEYRDDLVQSVGAELQGGMQCLYVDGTDDRVDISEVARALQRKLGTSAVRRLPREGEQHWIAARLVMLHAHDFKRRDLDLVDLSTSTAPSVSMATVEVKPSRNGYAIREAAKVMARAAAVPCLARFDREQTEVPKWFLPKPPMLGSCAILKAYVEYDRLE